MIHLRIYGGIGNQIFQLAAALLLAQKWGMSEIQIDENSLQLYATKRNNELRNIFDFDKLPKRNINIIWQRSNVFNAKFYKAFNRLLNQSVKLDKIIFSNSVLTLFFSKLFSKYFINDINYSYVLRNGLARKASMDGYFQQCWSQRDIEQAFEFLQTIYKRNGDIQLDGNECIIHIRGTDFLKFKIHNLLGQEYYEKAAKYMVEEYGVERFVVVTDDMEHAKSILQSFPYSYRFHSQDLKADFDLISSAHKKILANSTFSITASLLGSKEQVVIAPSHMTVDIKRVFKLPGEVDINYQK